MNSGLSLYQLDGDFILFNYIQRGGSDDNPIYFNIFRSYSWKTGWLQTQDLKVSYQNGSIFSESRYEKINEFILFGYNFTEFYPIFILGVIVIGFFSGIIFAKKIKKKHNS